MKTLDLQECRRQLDEIDSRIVELFEERMRVCGEVAAYKIETGKAVYDAEREKQKLNAVKEMAHGDFNREAVRELFSQLMAMSRRYQYGLLADHGKTAPMEFREVDRLDKEGARVVFQGVEGAYSHAAVRKFFGDRADAYHVEEFEDTMREVEEGKADYAVLPIENSTAGFVIKNYDLLSKYRNYIVGEVYVPICHMLLGVPGAELSDIRTVLSHPQALMQSSEYLGAHREWHQISMQNTAVAAKKVMEDGDKSQAAVASRTSGELYGLKELACEINNTKNNTTRFIVLSREPVYEKQAGKISICFEIPHMSGSLYNILGNFIFNHVNMVMIESRPIPEKPFEYRFFVDIEGKLGEASVQNALNGIRAEASVLKILGNY